LKANEKGKIKLKKIEDNTAAEVEILIHLPPGVSPDKTIDALYAFTACETSVAPLGCVIENHKPLFIGVTEMLKISTHRTVDLLKRELEIQLDELENKWHFATLEKSLFVKKCTSILNCIPIENHFTYTCTTVSNRFLNHLFEKSTMTICKN